MIRGATVSGIESLTAKAYESRSLGDLRSRRDVVALGLCCGTDLDDGVPGVGPARVMSFLEACRGRSVDAIDELRRLRDDPKPTCPRVADEGPIGRHCRTHAWPSEEVLDASPGQRLRPTCRRDDRPH